MGVCLGLEFDKKLPEAKEFSDYTDGKDLASAMGTLDAICNAKGLTPFSTFARPDYEDMDEEELEESEIDETYFNCGDALRIIPELIAALQSEKQWTKELGKGLVKDVIECLQELDRLLKVGKKKKARFYLLYY